MVTNEELDSEFRFSVKAYSDGVAEDVDAELQNPTRQEQREGFFGLIKWATRVVRTNESDRVVVMIHQKDDGGNWHQLMIAEVDAAEAWIKVKGEFPKIII